MSKESNSLVSVLMTSFNREKFIGDAIQSVLNSTYNDFELIVVDDCSKDQTLDIAHSFENKDARIKVYVNNTNLGDYPNRNKAASYAKGKYIKYLDSDDYLYPHGLGVLVSSMEQFPEAGFGMMSRGDYISPYPKSLSPKETYLEHFDGYGHLHRAPGSAIINREAFQALGGFSGRNVIGDVEFWFKIASRYPMVKICDDLYWPRSHDSQQKDSITEYKYEDLRAELLEQALSDKLCPLSPEEIYRVRAVMKRNITKHRFFRTLSKVRRVLLGSK